MKTGDILVLIILIVSIGVAIWADFDARDDCLVSKKPETDSTSFRFIAPFTGKYKRIDGVLFCRDSRGTLHAYSKK